jgi:hypothetical protein
MIHTMSILKMARFQVQSKEITWHENHSRVERLTKGGHRGAEMCSLGWKKGVMDSPTANTGTYFLAPSFSSNGSRFNIGVGLEEEEPNLEPWDLEARDIVQWKMKNGKEVLDFLKNLEQETKRVQK